jgi:hypothetical protein
MRKQFAQNDFPAVHPRLRKLQLYHIGSSSPEFRPSRVERVFAPGGQPHGTNAPVHTQRAPRRRKIVSASSHIFLSLSAPLRLCVESFVVHLQLLMQATRRRKGAKAQRNADKGTRGGLRRGPAAGGYSPDPAELATMLTSPGRAVVRRVGNGEAARGRSKTRASFPELPLLP